MGAAALARPLSVPAPVSIPASASSSSASAVLEALRERTRPVNLSGERLLPVREDLASLLPGGGLRRGSVVEIDAPSLLFVVMAEALRVGSWAALVGLPALGLAAARDHGITFERLAVVVAPPVDLAATVVASLVDALDLVVLGPGVVGRAADARRLTARARERESVLLVHGRWPEAVDLRLTVVNRHFEGIGQGHGHLRSWSVEVQTDGRGAAARRRRGLITLAGPELVGPEQAEPGPAGLAVGGSGGPG